MQEGEALQALTLILPAKFWEGTGAVKQGLSAVKSFRVGFRVDQRLECMQQDPRVKQSSSFAEPLARI